MNWKAVLTPPLLLCFYTSLLCYVLSLLEIPHLSRLHLPLIPSDATKQPKQLKWEPAQLCLNKQTAHRRSGSPRWHTHACRSLDGGRSAATQLNGTGTDTINEMNLPHCEMDSRNTANRNERRLTQSVYKHTRRTQVASLCSVSHNRTQTVNTFGPHRILNLGTEGDKHIYHAHALSSIISISPRHASTPNATPSLISLKLIFF